MQRCGIGRRRWSTSASLGKRRREEVEDRSNGAAWPWQTETQIASSSSIFGSRRGHGAKWGTAAVRANPRLLPLRGLPRARVNQSIRVFRPQVSAETIRDQTTTKPRESFKHARILREHFTQARQIRVCPRQGSQMRRNRSGLNFKIGEF
jgi:hypothetical protein